MPIYTIIVIYKKALTLIFFFGCRAVYIILVPSFAWSLNCRRCLSTVKIFRISSTLIYWMSYCRKLVFFAYSKYFIMKEFKTSTERNSRPTDLPSEIWQPLLSRLGESNTKIEFVFHISAVLVPEHAKIASLPISSEERHLWWKNKST